MSNFIYHFIKIIFSPTTKLKRGAVNIVYMPPEHRTLLTYIFHLHSSKSAAVADTVILIHNLDSFIYFLILFLAQCDSTESHNHHIRYVSFSNPSPEIIMDLSKVPLITIPWEKYCRIVGPFLHDK